MTIKTKRIYESPDKNDGYRILIDRLWPRGISKEKAKVDLWLKEIAPTDTLRKWFDHEEKKWQSFKNRYKKQLNTNKRKRLVKEIKQIEEDKGTITFVYSAKDVDYNNSVVIKEYIEKGE